MKPRVQHAGPLELTLARGHDPRADLAGRFRHFLGLQLVGRYRPDGDRQVDAIAEGA